MRSINKPRNTRDNPKPFKCLYFSIAFGIGDITRCVVTDLLYFVALQVANKMPLNFGTFLQQSLVGGLLYQFIDIILAKMTLTNRVGFQNRWCWFGLADGHQDGFLGLNGLERK